MKDPTYMYIYLLLRWPFMDNPMTVAMGTVQELSVFCQDNNHNEAICVGTNSEVNGVQGNELTHHDTMHK